MKLSELFPELFFESKPKAPTIKSATMVNGEINRKTADRILDPKGYFAKNKRKLKK